MSSVSALARSFSSVSVKESAAELPNVFLAPTPPEKPARVVRLNEPLAIDYSDDKRKINLPVLDLKSQESSSIQVDSSVFGAPLRKDILQRVVKWQLAKRRQGSHKTKSRSETSGSTRKPWAQKGSGRARVGDIRAPQWRGGYRVFGKTPRDYSYSLNKKVRSMGVRVALSAKLREGKLAVVEDLDVGINKTKEMAELLESKGWEDVLFIDVDNVNEEFARATKNLQRISILPDVGANVYSILQRDLLVITKEAVEKLDERLAVE